MQFWLFECALIDWLGIFCMAHTMFRGRVVPRTCGSLEPVLRLVAVRNWHETTE
jgi:hypothetical protein